MSQKDPCILLYVKEWLISTAGMPADARGWYLSLLLHQVDKGSIPSDIEDIELMAGVKFSEHDKFLFAWHKYLRPKFIENESGDLENPKMKDVITDREIFKDKRSRSGNIGVVIKLAKQVKGYAKFADKLSKYLKSLCDEEIELLKEPEALTLLIEEHFGDVAEKPAGFDLSFIAPEFLEVFTYWMNYKKGRRESYATQSSLQVAYNRMLKLSNNNAVTAKLIVEQAEGNNHAGLYPLKANNAPAPVKDKASDLLSQNERLKNQRNEIRFTDQQ